MGMETVRRRQLMRRVCITMIETIGKKLYNGCIWRCPTLRDERVGQEGDIEQSMRRRTYVISACVSGCHGILLRVNKCMHLAVPVCIIASLVYIRACATWAARMFCVYSTSCAAYCVPCGSIKSV